MTHEIMIFEHVALEGTFLEEKRMLKIIVEPILYICSCHSNFLQEESYT